MYKVFLIDDEPWAMESLLHVLDLSAHSFELAGRFTDGAEAWETLCRQPPDVAFVDIRMPGLDGLTIARQAAQKGLSTLFVIVSGYGEFNYAQDAIRFGVCDYCLKPLERREASRLMDKLRQKLDARRSAANAALCEEIMSGTGADKLFERQGIAVTGTHWQVVTIRFVTKQAFQDIKAAFGDFPHLIVWLGITKLTVIVHGNESLPAQIEALCDRLAHAHPRLLIGISQPTRHPEHLVSRISQAQGCAYHDFIDPNRRMVAYRAGECLPLFQWATQMCEAIAQRNSARYQARLAELTPLLLTEHVQMASLVRVWNDLMEAFEAHARTPEVLNEIKRVSEAEELHAFLSDLSSLVAYLRALMEQYLSEDAPRPAAVNESFLEMLDYVREHCCQRLRLADLADQFHLNMAYTSELFHKVVGMTFTDYLTRLRMERAQAMIAAGNNTLTEIALSVGYGDYFTFSKRFKQYYGLSPSQAAQKKQY